ncbi:MAG: PaaI family thioesterase [Dehalococcoidia bacterium]|nr:MAG: PaaI family thioesterase [Dehalococcoidia bacterium]
MVTGPQISIAISDLCFGCGRNNPCGLKLKFEWDGKKARAEFTPNKFHQGLAGIIHGGIITTILDEAMGYATYYEGIMCVTATMQIKFKRPLLIDEPTIVTASMTKNARRFTETEAKMTLKDGTLIAECTAMQYVGSSEPKNNA